MQFLVFEPCKYASAVHLYSCPPAFNKLYSYRRTSALIISRSCPINDEWSRNEKAARTEIALESAYFTSWLTSRRQICTNYRSLDAQWQRREETAAAAEMVGLEDDMC